MNPTSTRLKVRVGRRGVLAAFFGSPWIGKFTLHCFTPFKEVGKDDENLSKLVPKKSALAASNSFIFPLRGPVEDPC